MFKNKIHKAYGQKFEDLFTAIMNYKEADSCPIKPYRKLEGKTKK